METNETSLQAEVHLAQAAALETEGALEAALLECDAALSLLPDWADAHYLRGTLLAGLERLPEAIAEFESALALDPGLHDAREEQVVAQLREAAREYLESAQCLRAEGDNERAYLECRFALALQPEWAAAHNLHGLLLEDFGEYARALDAFHQALNLDPEFEDAQQNAQRVSSQLEKEELIAVARYINPAQAHIARDLLIMEGIDAIVTDESMGNLLGMLSIGGGRVMVRASDADRAQDILETAFESVEDDDFEDDDDFGGKDDFEDEDDSADEGDFENDK
ncbi:MAG: DUF2007 domain-containing protein [Anaerolineae bacterium]|jgi:tetratricopeptide (TPR) repeat protein|nr:DUF2007 domain-containing protein [Anaerolineae bacterium]